MLDKYLATRKVLHTEIEDGLEIIQILQCVPKDGLKAFGLLKVAKHHKEVVLFLLEDFKLKAEACKKYLMNIDSEYAKNQIKSIDEDLRKYNITSEKLLGLIDIELEKTAYNL